MIILAIDTSCDDTSVSVAEQKNKQIKILSNIVSSQIKIHSPYGGVYPALAKREHQNNLAITAEKALKKAHLLKILNPKSETLNKSKIQNSKFKTLNKILARDEILKEKTINFLNKYEKPKIDAIAITNGPGLEPCLWQGVNFAKALAFWWDLPIIPINHIKAHLAANFIHSAQSAAIFPAVGLVASGGHTELILMPKSGQYKLIGSTRDDAAGECFDKTARILGLPYPGGPSLALQAKLKVKNEKLKVELPRPMLHSNDFDFSFSGLKTAVLYNFKGGDKTAWAKEIQQAIVDVLTEKTLKAASRFGAKSIITGGGVMANKELRRQLKVQSAKCKVSFYVPDFKLCLDNGAMVGACALLDRPKKTSWQKIKVNGNLDI